MTASVPATRSSARLSRTAVRPIALRGTVRSGMPSISFSCMRAPTVSDQLGIRSTCTPRSPSSQTTAVRSRDSLNGRREHHAIHPQMTDEADHVDVVGLLAGEVHVRLRADSPLGVAVDLPDDHLGLVGRPDHERVLQVPGLPARDRSRDGAERRSGGARSGPRRARAGRAGPSSEPTSVEREDGHPAPHGRHLEHGADLVGGPVVRPVAVEVVEAGARTRAAPRAAR